MALVEAVEADIPECMFENEVEAMIQDYSYRMQSQGISMEMYMKYTGMTMENFKEQFKPQAESQVKLQLALEKIVELENITATEEDVEAEYAKLAEAYKMEVEKIKEAIQSEMLKKDIAVNKAVALVRENAKITEKAEGEEDPKKAPAKKTAAKKTEEKAEGEEAPKKAPAKKTTSTKSTATKTTTAKKTTTTKAKKEETAE